MWERGKNPTAELGRNQPGGQSETVFRSSHLIHSDPKVEEKNTVQAFMSKRFSQDTNLRMLVGLDPQQYSLTNERLEDPGPIGIPLWKEEHTKLSRSSQCLLLVASDRS